MANNNTLTWDLVARDKSVSDTFDKVARAGDGLGEKLGGVGDQAAKKFKDSSKKIDSAFRSAFRSVSSDLDKVQAEAWASGDKMDDKFVRSAEEIRRALQKIDTQAGATGAELSSELGDALRRVRRDVDRMSSDARRDIEKIGDEAKEAGDEVESAFGGDLLESLSGGLSGGFDASGIFESITGSLGDLGKIGGVGFAVGGALAAAVWSAFEAESQQDRIGGLIAAQSGGTAVQGRRLGDIAGDAFYDGFGESIEAVGEALTAVTATGLIDIDASEEDLKHLTELATTASQVVGEEASQIGRAAQQLLLTGLADNAEHAIDIIVAASQKGLNVSDDLIDTIIEYGGQFERLGLTGEQSMGLISQALQAGARDTDYAADAIKEFAIRAQDGSVATARGFRAIGLDADAMGQAIARGGDSARNALGDTLDRLRAIEDPVLRNQAAVDLFGTKAEDLGDALYAMDLDTVAGQLGEVDGATQRAQDTIAATTPATEKLGRGFGKLRDDALESVFDVIEGVAGINDEVTQFTGGSWSNDGARKFRDLGDGAEGAAGSVAGFGDSMDDATGEGTEFVATLDEIISKQRELAGGVLDLSEAQIAWEKNLDNITEALEENGATMDITTEAGRNNRSALNDLADSAYEVVASMEAQGASAEEVQAFMGRARGEFIRSATQLGLTAGQANALANKLGLIPGNYRANVQAATAGAMAALGRVGSFLDRLDGKSATVHVGAVGSGVGLVGTAGSILSGFRAEGGPVRKGEGYWVGEEGEPEWFEPDTNGMIYNQDQLRAAASSLSVGGGGPARGGYAPMRIEAVLAGDTDSAMGTAIATMIRKGSLQLRVVGDRVRP